MTPEPLVSLTSTPAPVDWDLACAVALGLVDHPHLRANARQVTILDIRGHTVAVHPNWLSPADPLHLATLQYLRSREVAQKTTAKPAYGAWNQASSIKTREEAVRLANSAKQEAARILADRGVLTRARTQGLHTVMG